ncbi:uroporphyrinogen-III synthase [Phenylobacterium sp.]|uniref:uroporphyrinogen-III synthase n=1 Tax=Phenylobacterium sp. TaxID=1871053 RepID=UPI002733F989|nr:uroporphyrinogen-III synthase [Phenylobacterium sp.]MDP3634059.1 uroporphyrinogen-III synthase [Phenylobacterium sp.]
MSARKIWITRAQPAAEATAARVRALGHEPFVAPLLAVQPVEGVEVDLRGVCALAFTSANGVRAFIEATPERSLRVFAVGAATAQAVRAAGFKNVLSADGDVEALAEGIAARKRDLKGCVLHPGAAEPAGDLVGALEAHGIEARRLVLYDTGPAELTAEELAALPEIDAVLLHSPKASQVLAAMLKETPLPDLRALCLSKAVMKPLARTKMAAKVFAPFPLEAALLNLIDR